MVRHRILTILNHKKFIKKKKKEEEEFDWNKTDISNQR